MQDWKDLFRRGLEFSLQKTPTTFVDPDPDLLESQLQEIEGASDLQQFGRALQRPNVVRGYGFPSYQLPPAPDLSREVNVDFGAGLWTRYAMSAGSDTISFFFSLWGLQIAPPELSGSRNRNTLWFMSGAVETGQTLYVMEGRYFVSQYEMWSQTEFIIQGQEGDISVRFGSPEVSRFQLNLGFGDHAVSAIWQTKSPPRALALADPTFAFLDASVDITLDALPPSSGLGFIMKSVAATPPQFPTLQPRRATVLLQFPTYQIIFVTQLLSNNVMPGELFKNPLQLSRFNLGFPVSTSGEMQVTDVADGQWPWGIEAIFQEAAIDGDAGFCFAETPSPHWQTDYQAVLRVRDMYNTVGSGYIRIDNTMNPRYAPTLRNVGLHEFLDWGIYVTLIAIALILCLIFFLV
jgi:hypothetical protein